MIPLEYIDLYCERTGHGFWNEPLNALSNVSFLVAAFVAWRTYLRLERRDPLAVVLIVLAASIGVGSFLFHTFASGWAELADVIPIWSFVAFFVLVIIYRMTGDNIWITARIALIVVGSIGIVFWMTSGDVTTGDAAGPDYLNGSLQYLLSAAGSGDLLGGDLAEPPSGTLLCNRSRAHLPAVARLQDRRPNELRNDRARNAFHLAHSQRPDDRPAASVSCEVSQRLAPRRQ